MAPYFWGLIMPFLHFNVVKTIHRVKLELKGGGIGLNGLNFITSTTPHAFLVHFSRNLNFEAFM